MTFGAVFSARLVFSTGGFHCLFATKPISSETSKRRARCHCNLVILDLAMPNLSGPETTAILRGRTPQVKIVGFSALLGDADFREKLLAAKTFDAVLSKQDGLNKLLETVVALMPDPMRG